MRRARRAASPASIAIASYSTRQSRHLYTERVRSAILGPTLERTDSRAVCGRAPSGACGPGSPAHPPRQPAPALRPPTGELHLRALYALPQLGYVRLGPRRRIFALSMSHAAHCVYLFARAIALADGGGAPSEAHLQHCMNYVRQHVLCEADATLEEPAWVESAEAGAWGTVGAVGAPRERACRDWRVVYHAVEEDYRRWMEYRAQNWEGD